MGFLLLGAILPQSGRLRLAAWIEPVEVRLVPATCLLLATLMYWGIRLVYFLPYTSKLLAQ